MTPAPQLGLKLPHRSAYRPDDFLVGAPNQDAWTWIGRMADWPDHRLLIWGEPGCGKTHLLHVWARRTGAEVRSATALSGLPAEPDGAGLAIDDADQAADEPALLHLLNLCRERAIPVLLAAGSPPARWTIRLPDLASRLRATTSVPILPPDDMFRHSLLLRLLGDHHLRFTPTLPDWMLRRVGRSPQDLRDAVERLDHATLAERVRLTRKFAARVLGLREAELDSADDENAASDDDPAAPPARFPLDSPATDL